MRIDDLLGIRFCLLGEQSGASERSVLGIFEFGRFFLRLLGFKRPREKGVVWLLGGAEAEEAARLAALGVVSKHNPH